MTFLKTLLGSFAICAVLLALAALTLGPSSTGMNSHPRGLTAASVLASDGMGPDGRPGEGTLVPRMPGHVAIAPVGHTQPAG